MEQRRRRQLALQSITYGWFGDLIRALAEKREWWPAKSTSAVELQLNRTGRSLPWKADEWIAATLMEAVLLGCVAAVSSKYLLGDVVQSLLAGMGMSAMYTLFSWQILRRQARRRLGAIRTRLPFVIDSIALAMEAGAGIQEGLALAAESCPTAAIGQELADVVADTRRGQPLGEALAVLRGRLQEPMIDEFVMAANTCHQLGAGVSQVLLGMSKRIRERRSHEIESAVGRAQIQLYYPGTLLLVVCMVAVVAPFVMPMWNFLDGTGQ